MATMNVSLPAPMKAWVDAQTKGGRYGNASDYVRDLIRRDQDRQNTVSSSVTDTAPPSLSQHALVLLNTDLATNGRTLPKGARGTVVAVYKDNAAYEVEFSEPFHAVVTVTPQALGI